MAMNFKLYEASVSGNAVALNQLIAADASNLQKVKEGFSYQTSLHIAASLGHLSLTEALLEHDNGLAFKPDSCGHLPLHLASEKGHVVIVEKLLAADANHANCTYPDKDGKIPLHLAVMQGHLLVMLKLIKAKPDSIKQRVRDTGESVLHLCVEYNRLEALKLLLDLTQRGDELGKCEDAEGNTVLHVGAALNRTEIIKCLTVVPAVREIFGYTNKKGLTALNVSKQFAIQNSDSMQIQEMLRTDDDPRATNLTKYLFPINDEWLKEFRGHLITTMALIATVTFQAGLAPPGGVWQDDNKSIDSQNSHDAPAPSPGDVYHEPGTSITASKNSELHRLFVLFNTFSFATSLLVIFLLIIGVPFTKKAAMATLNGTVLLSLTCMGISYCMSIDMMSPKTERDREKLLSAVYSSLIIVYVECGLISLWSLFYQRPRFIYATA